MGELSNVVIGIMLFSLVIIGFSNYAVDVANNSNVTNNLSSFNSELNVSGIEKNITSVASDTLQSKDLVSSVLSSIPIISNVFNVVKPIYSTTTTFTNQALTSIASNVGFGSEEGKPNLWLAVLLAIIGFWVSIKIINAVMGREPL